MDNNVREQAQSAPADAEAQAFVSKDKAEGNSYGKFKSKEGLMEAYNSLESEFTRRSQRIKELESQLSNRSIDDKWTKKVDELTAKYPVARDYTAEIGEVIAEKKELLEDENCLEKALLAVLAARYKSPETGTRAGAVEGQKPRADANASVKERAEAYFYAEAVPVPEVLPQGGELPAAPRVRPKDMREAGEMARKLLQ